MFLLLYRVAGKSDAEFLEYFAVYFAEHYGGVYLASVELGELVEGAATIFVGRAEEREGYEDFVGVEARIATVEEGYLRALDGLYHRLGYELYFVGDACQVLRCVEDERCAGAQQFAGACLDDGAVLKLYGCGGAVPLFLAFARGYGGAAVVGGELCLLHDEGYLVYLMFVVGAEGVAVEGVVMAADDFVARGIAAHFFVAHAEAYHVYAHVGGRLIGVFAVDAFKDGVEHGEYLDVAVVVDGYFAVGFEMQGVNHVDVVEVGGCCLVGDVDGVLQGEVPHGEGFKLCVACLDAALMLVVELAEAYCHLAASRSWGCYDDKGAGGLDVVVAPEAFVGVDELYVVGVAVDGVVVIHLDADALKAVAIGVGAGLSVVVGDNYTAHVKSDVFKFASQAEYVFVVGDAEVATYLVFLNIVGADDHDDFGFIAQLEQHLQLAVGLKAGEHAAGMVVVKQFTAKFEVKFIAELSDALLDVFGLYGEVFPVVKSLFHVCKVTARYFCSKAFY